MFIVGFVNGFFTETFSPLLVIIEEDALLERPGNLLADSRAKVKLEAAS